MAEDPGKPEEKPAPGDPPEPKPPPVAGAPFVPAAPAARVFLPRPVRPPTPSQQGAPAASTAPRAYTEAELASLSAVFAKLAQASGSQVKTTAKVEPAAESEKVEEAVQRWWLRYGVAAFVLGTLWVELIAIFFLLLWQGRGGGFKLNDWLIGVAVGGVFIQTMWCLHAIAAHLFPEGADKMKDRPKGLGGE